MKNETVRYIVKDSWGEFVTSYSAALGKDALKFAKQTAHFVGGKIEAEYSDGSILMVKSVN